MKFVTILGLASAALAFPASNKTDASVSIEMYPPAVNVGAIANDFKEYGCKEILFFFGRGSLEPGNMGSVIGPALGEGLKKRFPGKVAIQGVDYPALLATNLRPGGADPEGIRELHNLVSSAIARCPGSIIVTGGYSQGAALNHRVLEHLTQPSIDRIAGVVLFGDTQNKPDKGRIPHFPVKKVKIFCASHPRDEVCDGNLEAAFRAPHRSYGRDARKAADFLAAKIRKMQSA